MRRFITVAVVAGMWASVGVGRAATFESIPLVVDEPAGVPREAAPVTGGVPLPPGVVKSVDQLVVLGPDGKPVPAQFTPLVTLEDGSIHWVLVDLQATVPAKGKAAFTLAPKTGAAPEPKAKVTVRELPGRGLILIETGALRAVLNANRFDLFESVFVDLNGDGTVADDERVALADAGVPSLSLFDTEADTPCATRYAGLPSIGIEYAGPLRAVVKFAGRYLDPAHRSSGLDYTTRITAFAGKPYLVVEHRIRNADREAARTARIRQATLSIVLDVAEPMMSTVGAQEILRDRFAEEAVPVSRVKSLYLHQQGPPRTIALTDDWRDHARYSGSEAGYKLYTTRSRNRRPIIDVGWWAKGWIDITDTRAGLTMAVRDFAKDWPIAMGAEIMNLEPNRLVRMSVDLVPPAQGTGIPRYADGHFLLNDLMHKSVEVLFDFHGPGVAPEAMAAAVARFRGPLVLRAPAEWYNRTGALAGDFATLDDELAAYKVWQWSYTPDLLPKAPHAPERFTYYTDVHWVSESDDAADNLLQFIRTGERGFLDAGRAWARYYRDTYAARTDGFDYAAQRPPAKDQKPLSREEQQAVQSWHAGSLRGDLGGFCHAYGYGLVDHFLLTGERESLEAAEDLAEMVAAVTARAVPGKAGAGGRGSGRQLLIACRVYEGTRKEKWLDLVKHVGRVCSIPSNRDERGMTPVGGYGFGGPAKTPRGQQLIKELDLKPRAVATSGTWGDALHMAAVDRYWALTGDEDARDLVIGYGELMNRYGIHKTLHCASYYYEWDFPKKGDVWFSNLDGQLDPQPGNDWYSTSVTDMPVRAYRHTGRTYLLEQGRRFWTIGRQNLHDPEKWFAPQAAKGFMGPGNTPYAKLLFREYGRPRADADPPAAVTDLAATVSGTDVALTWTAPADKGGKVAVYQVKHAPLPLVDYKDFDFARDDGVKRNWWFAPNVSGEPAPGPPGTKERFVLKGLPSGVHYLALRSRDDSSNESELSNVVKVEVK